MIPGISNMPGVGDGPLQRGAVKMMEYADDVGIDAGKKKGQVFFSPQPRGPQASFRKDMGRNNQMALSPRVGRATSQSLDR